jgi:cytoskeleton protein RodZ
MFEIGSTLLEARSRRNLDIPTCEAGTKIRAKYLRAMEEEQFDVLPSPTYVRGFLRTYSEFLGLDGGLLVDEYESRFARPEERAGDHRTRTRAEHGRPRSGASPRGRRKRRTEAQLLWLALGGVMGVALLVWLGAGGGPSTSQPLGNGLPSGPVTPTSQSPTLATPEQSQPVKVQLIGVGTYGSYVDVRLGGTTGTQLFTGLVAPGATQTYRTMSSIWLLVANPTGLQVNVDGKVSNLPSNQTAFLVTKSGVQPAPKT